MLTITNVTSGGKIYFKVEENLNGVSLKIRDDKFEGNIFSIQYDSLKPNVEYYVLISSVVVPSLKKTYIYIQDSDNKEFKTYFEFPSNLLEGYSLIGNSCVAWRTYEVANTEYNSPTIGNLILDDLEYLRFCEHLDTYLKVIPILGESNGNINFKKQTGSSRLINHNAKIPHDYPITHHLDIEIHWIHTRPRSLEFNDGVYTFIEDINEKIEPTEFINKWNRRRDRGLNDKKICLWSASELYNAHGEWERKQIIDRFKQIPSRSIFLTERKGEEFEDELHIVKYVPEWEGNHQEQRDGFGGVIWNNQQSNAHKFFDIIKNKFL